MVKPQEPQPKPTRTYTPRTSKPKGTFTLPLEYKNDVIDAVDTWLKSYKSKHNDKTNRQRIRMQQIIKSLS